MGNSYDLALDPNPRTLVFRAIDTILRNDATLKRVIPRGAFRSWTGDPSDKQDVAVGQAPAIRLTPTNGPEQFWTPGAQKGALFINVEMLVRGTNVDNVNNLWWAIERAIYPADVATRNAQIAKLTAAGALNGLAVFSLPACQPNPSGDFFLATGHIKIEVNLQLNT